MTDSSTVLSQLLQLVSILDFKTVEENGFRLEYKLRSLTRWNHIGGLLSLLGLAFMILTEV